MICASCSKLQSSKGSRVEFLQFRSRGKHPLFSTVGLEGVGVCVIGYRLDCGALSPTDPLGRDEQLDSRDTRLDTHM